MSEVDRIYQKYMTVFYEVDGGGTWIDLSAVRYALRAALREMADGVMRPAPTVDLRQVEALNGQIERLNDWLFEHAHDLAHDPYTDTAGAMIAAADRLRGHVARLSVELAAAIDERNAADVGCTDAERAAAQRRIETEQAIAAMNAVMIEAAALRQQLVDLDADNARLVQELRTLRSWVTAPTGNSNGVTDDFGTVITAPGKTRTVPEMLAAVDAANGDSTPADAGKRPVDRYVAAVVAAGNPALSAAAADFMDGLMAARWTWRQVPKPVRLELVRHVIGMLENPTQAEFDAYKPDWMPVATANVTTFGVKWSQLVDLQHEIEVAA